MPNTRKADFYLGCLDGSVFIDFNRIGNDQMSLVRISFDGYGCCNLDEKAEFLNKKESALLIEELNKEHLNQEAITALVKKAIKINKEHIWNDALEKYELIEKKKKTPNTVYKIRAI
ncbi:hypothetical protein [Aquimarina sp. Aq78]|uniref:hypothetical protein n=1 Tax=Aquimarina sp. Aq78 TaxID=1191889 RepID=UPI00131A62D8|nr:hypothetical protein [Aquimarina sp. Aq78]